MSEPAAVDRSSTQLSSSRRPRRTPQPIELWCLHGDTDDLRGLAVETSFGYALGLELDAELVLLHLQPTLEAVVAYAERIEAALIAHGWQLKPARGERSETR